MALFQYSLIAGSKYLKMEKKSEHRILFFVYVVQKMISGIQSMHAFYPKFSLVQMNIFDM